MEVTERSVAEPGMTEVLGGHATNPATPRTVGFPLPALGQVFTVSSLENSIKAQFEQYVRGQTLKLLAALDRTDPDEADKQRSTFQGDFDAGQYNWDVFDEGIKISKTRSSTRGATHLIMLLIQRCHPKVTEETVVAILKDNMKGALDALRWAMSGNSQLPQPGEAAGETTKPAVA